MPLTNVVQVPAVLTEESAARLALANNAPFLELMEDLGIARAELIRAKELPNPGFSVLFPLGPKQLEFASRIPVEALWLRPGRVAIATADANAVSERLLQDGLDLVRDVKVACADLRLTRWKVKIAKDEAAIQQRFASVARSRGEGGDISELEVSTAEVDSIQARISRDRAPLEVDLAFERLRLLLGLSNAPAEFSLSKVPSVPRVARSEEELLALAMAARPDLRAAGMQIEAAAKRFGLSQAEVFQVSAIFDSNGDGTAFESGPGLEMTLPIFHQNQGAKALEDARFQKACRRYRVVEDQIAMEVRQALARYRQADSDLHRIENELLPALRRNRAGAEKAWEGGEVEYLFVLDVNRKMQSARLAEAEATAELLRASAELQRSTGAGCLTPPDKDVVSDPT